MDRKILIDLLDDFAFGSHNIEQTADRITELYKQDQALQLQQTGVSGSRRFNIDFCGNLLAGIEINNNTPFVFGAMNGYGNGINVNDISVTEIINDCH
jgi:hypothetical protein